MERSSRKKSKKFVQRVHGRPYSFDIINRGVVRQGGLLPLKPPKDDTPAVFPGHGFTNRAVHKSLHVFVIPDMREASNHRIIASNARLRKEQPYLLGLFDSVLKLGRKFDNDVFVSLWMDCISDKNIHVSWVSSMPQLVMIFDCMMSYRSLDIGWYVLFTSPGAAESCVDGRFTLGLPCKGDPECHNPTLFSVFRGLGYAHKDALNKAFCKIQTDQNYFLPKYMLWYHDGVTCIRFLESRGAIELVGAVRCCEFYFRGPSPDRDPSLWACSVAARFDVSFDRPDSEVLALPGNVAIIQLKMRIAVKPFPITDIYRGDVSVFGNHNCQFMVVDCIKDDGPIMVTGNVSRLRDSPAYEEHYGAEFQQVLRDCMEAAMDSQDGTAPMYSVSQDYSFGV